MSGRLAGKVAVVMGAGSSAPGWSNGKSAAAAYARAGAAVLAVDFDLERAQETAGIIVGEGRVADAIRADATNEKDVEAVMAYAVKTMGGIDIVHNNVGIGGAFGAAHQHTVEAWDKEMAVSLKSAFLGVRAAIPHLRARGGGAIINISSIAAVRFVKGSSGVAYSVAKAGVEALTRACALDYGPDNIRVNCIRIGFCDSPVARQAYAMSGLSQEKVAAMIANTRERIPLRHERAEPADIAAAAVFLASEEARQITGVILNVDGGLDVAPI